MSAKRWILQIFVVALAIPASALDLPYYGEKFAEEMARLTPMQRRQRLHEILDGFHVERDGQPDVILKRCPRGQGRCYRHEPVSYSDARKALFGHLHLEQEGREYYITSVYCEVRLGPRDFRPGQRPGPDRIPDPTVLNAEHTWPQSHFTDGFPKNTQKSDLHILYPATAKSNSTRGNRPFADLDRVTERPCETSALGVVAQDQRQRYFQPNEGHKGNVARALFYFAVRYNVEVDSVQEEYLRQWHENDPVDDFETWRNEEIFKIQQVRNPFVDHPELVKDIADF